MSSSKVTAATANIEDASWYEYDLWHQLRNVSMTDSNLTKYDWWRRLGDSGSGDYSELQSSISLVSVSDQLLDGRLSLWKLLGLYLRAQTALISRQLYEFVTFSPLYVIQFQSAKLDLCDIFRWASRLTSTCYTVLVLWQYLGLQYSPELRLAMFTHAQLCSPSLALSLRWCTDTSDPGHFEPSKLRT